MDYRRVLQANTVLDQKYRVDRVIGSGGFGITYAAFDIGLATPVAIKEYFPSHFGMRDGTLSIQPRTEGDRDNFVRLRASFLREARVLALFDHPAIVRVISVFEGHGTAYLVMRYESGPSLKLWLTEIERRPTQDELDRIATPILSALEILHAADFLHRDIAPDNIIIRADGSPVLLDFGATRRVMGELTGKLTGIVKKGFSPQEQYSTNPSAQGPWTDIYAMGATLYRAVTGRPPQEATERMIEDRMVPTEQLAGDGYRPEFLAAIDMAIRPWPEERPRTIAAWRKMLLMGAGQPRPTRDARSPAAQTSTPAATEAPTSQPRSQPASAAAPVLPPPLPPPSSQSPQIQQAESARQSNPAPSTADAARQVERRSRNKAAWGAAIFAAGGLLMLASNTMGIKSALFGPRPAVSQQQVAPEDRRRHVTDTAETKSRIELDRRAAEEQRATEQRRIADAEAARLRIEQDRRAAEEARVAEQRRIADADAARLRIEQDRRAAEEARVAEQRRIAEADATRLRIEQDRRAAEEARKRDTASATEALKPFQLAPSSPPITNAPEEFRAAALSAVPALSPPAAPPPPDLTDLTRDIQQELKRVGCDPGRIDGKWGQNVRSALEQADRTAKLSVSTSGPTPEALAALKARSARICPLVCDPDETEINGRCVTKPTPKAEPKARPTPSSTTSEAPARKEPPASERQQGGGGGGGGGGRSCNAFPRPRTGETCVNARGKTCIAGGGPGSCS